MFILRRRCILYKETNLQKNNIYALQKKYIHTQYATHNINVRSSTSHQSK